MNTVVSLVAFLVIIPAAMLCYLPMKNQLRFSKGRIVRDCAILFVLAAAGMIGLEKINSELDSTLLLLPFLVVFCLYYIFSTRALVSQKLGIFSAVCALMAIAAELAYILYELCYGKDAFTDNSLTGNLMQLGFSVLIAVFCFQPLRHNGAYMIDNLRIDWIWLCTIPASAAVFLFLVITVPMIFEAGDGPGINWRVLILVLLMIAVYLFLMRMFSHICRVLLTAEKLKAQEMVFKIQRNQYESMAKTLEENRIVRHDARHSMSLARKLLEEGKTEELKRYLDVRIENMPADTVHQYCENGILNAVLNNISDRCDDAEIRFDLDVDIPAMGEHQSVDVATFLQNLGENAILGCETLPPRDRRFALSVKAVHGNELFIVSTNTFDGQVQKEYRDYLSTRGEEGGSGLGIPSMRSITSKYGGTLEISNTDAEFLVNARMRL